MTNQFDVQIAVHGHFHLYPMRLILQQTHLSHAMLGCEADENSSSLILPLI